MDYIRVAQMNVAELYPTIVYDEPKIQDLPAGAIIGGFAYSIPNKIRYILAPDVELACGVLPGDVTRVWLKDAYALPLRRRKAQIEEKPHDTPLLARKGKWGHCVYMDIEKAYPTILQLGYDLEYRRDRYLAAEPREVPRVIWSNKLCYSTAVSMSRAPLSNILIMGKDSPFEIHPYNQFSNPCLFNLARDTLNAIASEIARVLGNKLFYYNTDGCIVDEDYAELAQDIYRSWGFSAKIKHDGYTEIYGVGSYDIGKHKAQAKPRYAPDEYRNNLMSKDESLYLKRQWQKYLHYFLSHEGFSYPGKPFSYTAFNERITLPYA